MMIKLLTPKERFDDFVKSYFAPFLKELGFRKKSMHFHRQVGDFLWVISIQKSRYNSEDDLSFNVRWGVCLDEYRLPNVVPPKVIPAEYGVLGGSLQNFKERCSWYNMKVSDENPKEQDLEHFGRVKEVVQNDLIPFFESLKSVKAIIALLEEKLAEGKVKADALTGGTCEETLALLYRLIGKKEEGIRYFDKIISEAKIEGYKKRVIEFRQEYIDAPDPEKILE